jgi:hypothetical protein
MDLTDQQWTIIEPLFEEKRRPDGRGRPWRDARAVLNGVLWFLRTGGIRSSGDHPRRRIWVTPFWLEPETTDLPRMGNGARAASLLQDVYCRETDATRSNPGPQDAHAQNDRRRHSTRPGWLTSHYRHALGSLRPTILVASRHVPSSARARGCGSVWVDSRPWHWPTCSVDPEVKEVACKSAPLTSGRGIPKATVVLSADTQVQLHQYGVCFRVDLGLRR